jgi:hypothetical protein
MNEDALWVINQLQQGHDLRCQPPMSFSMAQSIFSGAQYVTLQKYFLTSKFSSSAKFNMQRSHTEHQWRCSYSSNL